MSINISKEITLCNKLEQCIFSKKHTINNTDRNKRKSRTQMATREKPVKTTSQ